VSHQLQSAPSPRPATRPYIAALIGAVCTLLLLALALTSSLPAFADEDGSPTPRPTATREGADTPTPVHQIPTPTTAHEATEAPTPARARPTETPVPPRPTDAPVPPRPTDAPLPPRLTDTPVAARPTDTPVPAAPTDTPVPARPADTPTPAVPTQVPQTTETLEPKAQNGGPSTSAPPPSRRPVAAPQPEPATAKASFVAPGEPAPVIPSPAVAASVADPPDPSLALDAAQFGARFDFLRAAPGIDLGDALSIDRDATQDSCDLQLLTSTGLAYWNCSTEVASFVTSDGRHHWAFLDGQFLEWAGPNADPPLKVASLGLPPTVNLACLGPDESPQDACIVSGGTTTAGFIEAPGAQCVYAFQVNLPLAQVHADLTDLPADYDLYLVDASANVVAQSVQEGTTPEAIDAVLKPGTFLLYVHSDPGRGVDPDNPFVLHLDMQPAPSDTTAAGGSPI